MSMKKVSYNISQIEEMVNKINKDNIIDASELPSYGSWNEKNLNYVIVNKEGYSLIEFDPYQNKKDQHLAIKTTDIDELLFEIFKASTRSIAVKYELQNRVPNQDTRIIYFEKHIEILNSLSLKKEYINKLKDYYVNLLQLKRPIDLPKKW